MKFRGAQSTQMSMLYRFALFLRFPESKIRCVLDAKRKTLRFAFALGTMVRGALLYFVKILKNRIRRGGSSRVGGVPAFRRRRCVFRPGPCLSPEALYFPPKALYFPLEALFFAGGATPEASDREAVRFEIAVARDRRLLRR